MRWIKVRSSGTDDAGKRDELNYVDATLAEFELGQVRKLLPPVRLRFTGQQLIAWVCSALRASHGVHHSLMPRSLAIMLAVIYPAPPDIAPPGCPAEPAL